MVILHVKLPIFVKLSAYKLSRKSAPLEEEDSVQKKLELF